MKKTVLLYALAASLACSCSDIQEAPEISGIQLVLTAYQEGTPDTKTAVENGGKQVFWEPGDEIKVFSGSRTGRFTANVSELTSVAEFTGHLEGSAPDVADIWAVYPYCEDASFDGESITTVIPSVQVARPGTFAQGANVAIAHSSTTNLQFYHVGGGIRFSLKERGVKSVRIKGNSGETLAGQICIGFDQSGLPAVNSIIGGASELTLYAPEYGTFEPDMWYYVTAVPCELQSGLSFFLDYSDGTVYEKTGTASVKLKRKVFASVKWLGPEISSEEATDLVRTGEDLLDSDNEEDLQEAFENFVEAVAADADSSKLYLAYCYEYGIGTEQDMEKAKAYYSEAAAEGNEEAQVKQDQLVEGNTNANINIPSASPRDLEDVVLMCDGTIKTPNGDGTFSSSEDRIIASTADEQLIYMSFRNPNRDKSDDSLILDAKETALSMLMWSIPFAFESMTDEEFAGMRKLLLSFPETTSLISAIESSVSEFGYLDMDRVSPEAEAASAKVSTLFRQQTRNQNSRLIPMLSKNNVKSFAITPEMITKKQESVGSNEEEGKPEFLGGSPFYYKGIKLVLDKVSQIPDTDKWKCKITVYNYLPIYLALSAGIKHGDTIIPVGESVLDHIVKPQNSNYIFAIGGVDGFFDTVSALWSFWSDTVLWLAGEKEFEDGYWNATETKFEMEIGSEEDVLLVWSADNDCPELFAYAFFKLCVIPVIKMIFKSDETTLESMFWETFMDFGTDTDFINRAQELYGKNDLGDYVEFIWDTSLDVIFDCLNKLPEKLWEINVEPRYKKVVKKWSRYENISNNKLATKAQFKADMGDIKWIKSFLKAERLFINTTSWVMYQREFKRSFFDFTFENVPISVSTGTPFKVDYLDWVCVPVSVSGGTATVRRGVVWSMTNDNPTLTGDDCTTVDDASQEKHFFVTVKGLPGKSKVFFRSFIVIEGSLATEIIYGNVVEYTTPWDDYVTQGDNEIWYTTTDGNAATPYASDAFGGLEIVSNIYDGDKGKLVFNGPLVEIGDNAFMNCDNLETVDLPETVNTLGKQAFQSCSSLLKVFFQGELATCGDCAFRFCDKLTRFNGYGASPNGRFLVVDGRLVAFAPYDYDMMDIVVPSGVTSIAPYIFEGEDYIYTISLPESLTDVGQNAFCQCTSLEEITFPASLKTFGDTPLAWCSSLKAVHMQSTLPPVRAGALMQGAAPGFKIYVPDASLQTYKAADKWSDDAAIIFPENGDDSDAIDLGLSVKWASFNLGAAAPEEYGDYFAWGETEPKTEYSYGTYKWMAKGKSSWEYITKYTIPDDYTRCLWYNNKQFIGDGKTLLDPDDDAATVALGSLWRIPTEAEWQELIDNCDFTPLVQDGVYSYEAKSRINGKTIVLPAAGYQYESDLSYTGERGFYWSSTLYAVTTVYRKTWSAGVVRLWQNGAPEISEDERFYGQSIRPVFGPRKEPEVPYASVSSVDIDLEELVLALSSQPRQLIATISPSYATNKNITWKSSDSSVATVSSSGLVTPVSAGRAYIIATTEDGGKSDDCLVIVKTDEEAFIPDLVNFGLSVKWAVFNLGAISPEESGNDYAWGETSPKEVYTWDNYIWKPVYGIDKMTDVTVLQEQDDAATHFLGEGWRTPTIADWDELLSKCDMYVEDYNGVHCIRISRNYFGRIYLPIPDDSCYYWLANLSSLREANAIHLTYYSSDFARSCKETIIRCAGAKIRPVYAE